jgi:hypothetical protein
MIKEAMGFIKCMNQQFLEDGVLREFISKGLWTPAIKEVQASIKKREREIKCLSCLVESLKKKREEENS